jgi:hypothetical protein
LVAVGLTLPAILLGGDSLYDTSHPQPVSCVESESANSTWGSAHYHHDQTLAAVVPSGGTQHAPELSILLRPVASSAVAARDLSVSRSLYRASLSLVAIGYSRKIEERTKVMKGMQNRETAKLITHG